MVMVAQTLNYHGQLIDGADEFRLESTQWFDTDGDGYGDEFNWI